MEKPTCQFIHALLEGLKEEHHSMILRKADPLLFHEEFKYVFVLFFTKKLLKTERKVIKSKGRVSEKGEILEVPGKFHVVRSGTVGLGKRCTLFISHI